MKKYISFYKKRLEEEKSLVMKELAESGANIGTRTRENWQAKVGDVDSLRSDSSDVADRLETYEENNALVKELDRRLIEIEGALEKIARTPDQFGVCSVCGKEIEGDRLEANPAASTCKEHLQKI